MNLVDEVRIRAGRGITSSRSRLSSLQPSPSRPIPPGKALGAPFAGTASPDARPHSLHTIEVFAWSVEHKGGKKDSFDGTFSLEHNVLILERKSGGRAHGAGDCPCRQQVPVQGSRRRRRRPGIDVREVASVVFPRSERGALGCSPNQIAASLLCHSVPAPCGEVNPHLG